MNTRHLSSTLPSLGWGLCLLAMPPASAAADSFMAVTSAEQPAKPQKPKAAKPPKPAPSGSGESKAERDKRLLRLPLTVPDQASHWQLRVPKERTADQWPGV